MDDAWYAINQGRVLSCCWSHVPPQLQQVYVDGDQLRHRGATISEYSLLIYSLSSFSTFDCCVFQCVNLHRGSPPWEMLPLAHPPLMNLKDSFSSPGGFGSRMGGRFGCAPPGVLWVSVAQPKGVGGWVSAWESPPPPGSLSEPAMYQDNTVMGSY